MANQNPYQKAVEREGFPSGGYPTKQQPVEKTTIDLVAVEEKTPPKKEKSANVAVEISPDSISSIKKDEKNTHSLYLSDSNWKELEIRAKKAKMSPSAYLDEILKKVFGL